MNKKNEGVAQCDPLLEEASCQPGGVEGNAVEDSAGAYEGAEKQERTSPLRCAIYVRRITADPEGEEALDPSEQEERIRERIAWDPDWVALPEVYGDDLTEGPAPRPGLQALFGDVAIGLVDQIAVYGLNYILEDQQDSAALLKCLEDCPRVKILSAGDTIVANTPRGGFTMHITTDYIAEPTYGQVM